MLKVLMKMLLTPNEHLTIILSAIRDYYPGETDIPILIVQKISKQLISSVNEQITTQDIYDEIEECFNFYNDFIRNKNVDLQEIDDDFYELVKTYLNMIVEENNEHNTNS